MSKTISLQQLDRVKSTYGATKTSIDFSSPQAVTREYNAMLANCVSLPDLGLMTERNVEAGNQRVGASKTQQQSRAISKSIDS